MDFKTSLDKYLTREPEDDFTPFVEAVYDNYTPNFWREVYEVPLNARQRFEDSEFENKWLNELFASDTPPEEAAKIIEQRHKEMFEKQNNKKPFKKKTNDRNNSKRAS